MDRYWLLTWTTYGSWLPGDRRGFVGKQCDEHGLPFIHNLPGTSYDAGVPPLERAMRAAMTGPPIRPDGEQSAVLLAQFQETARYRGWLLLAVAVMANHVHLVVGVPGDPEPETILHAFKSYATRALNRRWGQPASDTWWTASGSKRKLASAANVLAAAEYVRNQEYALVAWLNEAHLRDLARGGLASGGSYAPGTVTHAHLAVFARKMPPLNAGS